MSTSTQNFEIFIENLPLGLSSMTLFTLFGEAGHVRGAVITLGDVPEQSYACITMSTAEEVEKALNTFSGYELDGKLLSVSKEKPVREEPKKQTIPRAYSSTSKNIICVSNLQKDIENGRLEEMFSKYGKVEDVEISYSRFGQTSAYVIMTNETDMDDAIAALNGHSLDGGVTTLDVYPFRRNTKDSYE
ncbi:unnamed protein product [Lathyrus sativus]|nr:unnamed protein product [Lathyrus sativus]